MYGYARVYGDAWVFGDAWVASPLYIQGTKHAMTLCSFTEIAIGCTVHSIVDWKKKYKTIGAKAGYTKAEIKEYGEYIAMFAKAARRFQKASK